MKNEVLAHDVSTETVEPANGGSCERTDGFGLASNADYLAKCQVDTPPAIVQLIWQIVGKYREKVGTVFDAGAGDGRFSVGGSYDRYVGYELDPKRIPVAALPPNASILRSDAFALVEPKKFDLAVGNPPYVRHHDLSDTWRLNIASLIQQHSGVRPSGWSNAYLYFFWLALITTKTDGLVVYLVPFDWVTRPAAKSLRKYITDSGWRLDIYRFDKEPFIGVLTTACIAVVDKRSTSAATYFRIARNNSISKLRSPTLSAKRPLPYETCSPAAYARRGLSPGDQKVFLMNETQRVASNLEIGRDVVRAVSSFRHIESDQMNLTENFFQTHFIGAGAKCWLVKPSASPSKPLADYLEIFGTKCRDNATCRKRDVWWQFNMPPVPEILYASGFRGVRPKSMINDIEAIAVGSVCGIHIESRTLVRKVFDRIRSLDFSAQVVAMSRGFTKVEINQMNGVVSSSIK
jgi:hypothetical protein